MQAEFQGFFGLYIFIPEQHGKEPINIPHITSVAARVKRVVT
jgi:hypothetical protein